MSEPGSGKVKTSVGNTLTKVGAAIGFLGAVAMVVKLKITLTPQMQEVLFYKGLFAASATLLILGAWYGREGRREARERELASKADELSAGSADQLDLTGLHFPGVKVSEGAKPPDQL